MAPLIYFSVLAVNRGCQVWTLDKLGLFSKCQKMNIFIHNDLSKFEKNIRTCFTQCPVTPTSIDRSLYGQKIYAER